MQRSAEDLAKLYLGERIGEHVLAAGRNAGKAKGYMQLSGYATYAIRPGFPKHFLWSVSFALLTNFSTAPQESC